MSSISTNLAAEDGTVSEKLLFHKPGRSNTPTEAMALLGTESKLLRDDYGVSSCLLDQNSFCTGDRLEQLFGWRVCTIQGSNDLCAQPYHRGHTDSQPDSCTPPRSHSYPLSHTYQIAAHSHPYSNPRQANTHSYSETHPHHRSLPQPDASLADSIA